MIHRSSRHLLSRASLMVAAALLGSAPVAKAATLTWDISSAADATITAGSGTWTTSQGNWNNGIQSVNWAANDTANFAGADGNYTITVGGPITIGLGSTTAGGLNFLNSGYTLSATAARIISFQNTNATGYITVAAGKTATIGDNITIKKGSSGVSAQLDLYGGGTLVIGSGAVGGGALLDTTGNANTSNILNGSTLEVRAGGTASYGTSLIVGNTAGAVRITGGDLRIASAASNLIILNTGGVTGTGSISISSGTIQFTNATNTGGIRFGGGSSSALSNLEGTFNLDGGIVTANKVYLGGAYTGGGKYTAIFNFNGGTLRALKTNNTDFLTGITAAASGSNATGVFVKAGGAIIDSNTFDVTIGQSLLRDAALGVAADGGLTKKSAGILTLSGANTFTGGVTIEAGTLTVGNAGALNATAGSENAVTFSAASTGALRLNGNSIIIGNLTTNATPGTPVVENASATNATLTVGNAANLSGTFAGVIQNGTGAGTLGLTKAGNGTLTLSGANTFSGGVTINAGVLAVGNAGALNSTAGSENAVAFGAGSTGTLRLSGNSIALSNLTSNATPGAPVLENAAAGNATLTVGNAANLSGTFAGVIQNGTGAGTLGLTKAGTGTLTLTGNSTFTGATTVANGNLILAGAGSLSASGSVTVNGAAAKLIQNSSTALSAAVTVTQGTLTGSGTVNTVNVGAGTGGIITNNDGVGGATLTIGTLTLAGGAALNLTLAGGNTAAPLVVTNLLNNAALNAVTITAGNPTGWVNGTTYNIIDYGTLGGTGGYNFNKVANNVSGRQTATWADDTANGVITLSITGDKPVWTTGGDGKWNTTSTGNWQLLANGGATTFQALDEVLFNDSAGGSGTLVVEIDAADVATFATTFDNSAKNYALTGAFGISAGSLTKSGSGSLTISTNNAYAGGTLLNAGTLRATSFATALGSGPLTLAGGVLELANDAALAFGRNTTLTGSVQITSDRLSSGDGLTHTLGTLGLGAHTLTLRKGTNVATGLAGLTFGATTLTGTATFDLGADTTLTLGAVTNGANSATFRGAGRLGQTGVWGGGAGGLTFGADFTGIATLNQANTFTGGVVVEGGTLNVNHATALGGAAGTFRVANATIDNSSGATIALTNNNPIVIDGNVTFTGSADLNLGTGAISFGTAGGTERTLTVNGGATRTLTLGGVINASSLGLTKAGNGTLSLTGANKLYTGATTIAAGRLLVPSNLLGASSGFSLGEGATLESTGGFTLTANQSVTGTGTTGTITTTAATGLITTSGTTLSSSGTLTITRFSALGAGNSLTGGTINAGTATSRGLLVGNGNAGTFTISGGTWNSLGTSAQPDIVGNTATGNGTLIIAGGQYVNNVGAGSTILGNSSGAGTLTITSGSATIGNLTYNAANTGANTSAIVNLDGGTLTLSRITVTAGLTKELNFNGGQFIAGADLPGFAGLTTNVKDGGAKIDTNGFALTIADPMLNAGTGLGGLLKSGAGTLTLSGANTFRGGVTINAGVLVLGNAGAVNATVGSENTVAFGAASTATLRLNGSSVVAANLTSHATPGAPVVENAAAANAILTIGNASNFSGTFAGVFQDGTGAGKLGVTKAGNGTLTLTGANTHSGATTVAAGTLALGAANTLSANSDVVLADVAGATLSLGGFTQAVKSISGGGLNGGSISLGNDGGLTVAGAGSFAGVISGTGSSGLTKSGNGTLTLTGASTYAGPTNVTGGTLAFSGAGALGGSSTITINGANAALLHNGTVALAPAVILTQGSVSGTGTINALSVGDSSANTLAPGSGGVGTLTIGALDFLGAATINFAANGNAVSRLLPTSLTTAGGSVITLNITGVAPGGWTSGAYDLIEYGAHTGAFSAFTLGLVAGTTARTAPPTLSNVGNKIVLNILTETPKWSGLDTGGLWKAGPTGANKNWRLDPSTTATDYIEGDAVVFDDTATGTTIVEILGQVVQPSSVVFNNSLLDYTLASTDQLGIAGTTGLVKNGTGTLTIDAFNLYTGATVINAGKIVMGAGMLGVSPLTMAGGQLDLGGTNQTVTAVSITAPFGTGATFTSGSLSASSYAVSNAAGDVVLAASLDGTGATFTKSGAGTVTLSQLNSFSGATTVNAGSLVVTSTGTLGSTSALNILGGNVLLTAGSAVSSAMTLNLGGGSIDLGGGGQALGAVTVTAAASSGATIGNGTLTGTSYAVSNAMGNAVISANLGGTAVAFTKTGAGTVTLSGGNTYGGITTINGGVVSANTIADTVSSSLGLSLAANALTFGTNGGTLNFTGVGGITKRAITFNGPATFDISVGADLMIGTSIATPTTTEGLWSGAGSITKTGNGTLTIRNAGPANRITVDGLRGGNFSMQAGTLNITPTQYFTIGEGGSAASTFTQTGGTVNFTPTSTTAGNDVYVGNATVTGQLIVTGGTFNVTPSTLQIRVGQATAGTLSVGGAAGIATVDSPTVSLGVGAGNGLFNLYANGVLVTSALRDGAGTGTSTVNFDGGTLRAKSGSGINFMPSGFNTAAITGNGLTTDTNSFDVTIGQALSGAGALTKIGNGALTLSGVNSYAGGTTVTTGTLALGHATNTLADTGAVNVNGGTLSLGANSDTVGTVTLTGGSLTSTTGILTSAASFELRNGSVGAILGGTAGLNKTTAGTVTVTGANTFTGATSVSNGTLALSGSGSVNSSSGITIAGAGAKFVHTSSVTVSPTITLTQGTLTGTGNFAAVSVGAATGGVISNNDGLGGAALTIGTLTLAGGANLNLFSDGANTAAPLAVTSLANNAASGVVTLTANNTAGWTNGVTYSILDYGTQTGGLSGDFNRVVNNMSARQNATWADDLANGLITLTLTGDSPRWVGDTDGTWNTTTLNNWRLVTAGGYVTFLPTDDVLFDDTAPGTATVVIDQANVAPNSTVFANSTKNYVLSGAYGISSGSLTKSGAGSLTIGTVNTYAGATAINGGSVILTGAGTLGSGSALTLGGGSLDLGGTSQAVGAVAVTTAASSGETISNGSLTGSSYAVSNTTGTAIVSANLLLSGSAGLTKSGVGTLTLSGANTFSGGFTLDGGTVNINSAGALGTGPLTWTAGTIDNTSGSAVTLTNSAAQAWNTDLIFTGSNDLSLGTGPVTLSANRLLTVSASVLTLGGAIGGGAVSLTKAGAGTLVLSGANAYTGATNVHNGALRLVSAPLSSVTVILGNNTDSGRLILGQAGAVNQSIAVLQASGTGTSNAVVGGASAVSTLTLTNTGILTYAGRLGGAGLNENNLALTKTGASALILSGTSTYDGVTTISPGSAIIVAADGALGSATGNTLLGGVTAGNAGVLGLTGGITYAMTEKVIGLGAGNTGAVAGLAAVQRGLIQSVSGNNTFAGNLEISATGTSRVGVQDGAQLTLTGPITRAAGVTGVTLLFRAGTNDGDFITLASNANDWDTDTQIYSSNTGTGSGVRLGINDALPTAYSVVGANSTFAGTVFDLGGFNQTLNGLTSSGTVLRIVNTSATLSTLTLNNLSDKATGTGTVITDGTGTGKVAVVKTGAFTQVFQTANTYTGGTWIKEGMLRLYSGNDRLAVSGTVTLGDVATMGKLSIGEVATARAQTLAGLTTAGLGGSVVAASNANSSLTLNITAGTNTFDGTIGGALTNENNLNLTKTGNGVLSLANAGSTYAGTTTVNGGTLKVASLGTSGASSVGGSDRAIAANLLLNGAVRLEYAGTGEATSRSFTVSGTGVTLASSGSGAVDVTSATQVAFAADGASARELKLAGTNTGDNTYAATAAGTPAAADVFRKITKNEVGKWVIAGSGTTYADNLQVEVNAGLLAFGQAGLLRSGTAVVNGGTLVVTTGTNTNATVTVNNGGTLGGGASIGATIINSGGALSSGNSPGVFTSSALTLAGGAVINWQVMDALGTAGIGYDRLVTGQLDLRGASSANKIMLKVSSLTALDVDGNPLNFGAPDGVASIRTFQFGQAGGILLNNGVNISDVFAFDVSDFRYTDGSSSNAGLWSINWDIGTGAITLTAVPEPSTYGISLGALALAAAALRRRKKAAKEA